MSEYSQAALTVLVGVVVYVAGQFILKVFIEPMSQLLLEIGKALSTLEFYAGVYTNPGWDAIPADVRAEVSRALRRRAMLLSAKTNLVRWYWVSSRLRILPPRGNVDEAHSLLIFLSNALFSGDALKNYEVEEKILKLLKLH
ncbi:hypothetical protein MUP77_06685 [Candidatus Bathyarchaeota archaeon]|nr:hypothetical protein [Candidatus Bathyarchaeota archaeon]